MRSVDVELGGRRQLSNNEGDWKNCLSITIREEQLGLAVCNAAEIGFHKKSNK